MNPILPWLLAAACSAAVAGAGAGLAAERASPSSGPQAGKDRAGPSPGNASAPAHKPADPLGHLKPYEERRYRIDMQDCGKKQGVDRRLCERSVQRKAATKSRRRAAGR